MIPNEWLFLDTYIVIVIRYLILIINFTAHQLKSTSIDSICLVFIRHYCMLGIPINSNIAGQRVLTKFIFISLLDL